MHFLRLMHMLLQSATLVHVLTGTVCGCRTSLADIEDNVKVFSLPGKFLVRIIECQCKLLAGRRAGCDHC